MQDPSKRRLALAAMAVLAVSLSSASLAVAEELEVTRGRTFARANCAHCHAIGPTGTSPLFAAPPFRDLHRRYPVEDLAEPLAEGIMTGHPSMPQFTLHADEVADVIAYLKSLEH